MYTTSGESWRETVATAGQAGADARKFTVHHPIAELSGEAQMSQRHCANRSPSPERLSRELSTVL